MSPHTNSATNVLSMYKVIRGYVIHLSKIQLSQLLYNYQIPFNIYHHVILLPCWVYWLWKERKCVLYNILTRTFRSEVYFWRHWIKCFLIDVYNLPSVTQSIFSVYTPCFSKTAIRWTYSVLVLFFWDISVILVLFCLFYCIGYVVFIYNW